MTAKLPRQGVIKVEQCALKAIDAAWPYAVANHQEIDAHWQRRSAENPQFFNGRIRMLRDFEIAAGAFRGALIETEFKNFLYWREHGEADAGAKDCFASAMIVSSDRAVLMARQRAGNINAGLTYLPGGFIDGRDVAADGTIDIAASAAREVAEETGLSRADLAQRPGFLICLCDQQVAIAVVFEVRRRAKDLEAQVRAHLELDPSGELEEAIMVLETSDLKAFPVPRYAELLVNAHFSGL
jgi:8-oxo-dGTP pyrophosphatase MutT (NUDIX family)